MAFCHVYFWGAANGGFGHTGLALQTNAGLKTYITMLNDEGQGLAPNLPEELRLWTGIQGLEKHKTLVHKGADLRPGQRAQEVTSRLALGRRDSGGFRRNAGMSLVLAGGQIVQEPTEIVELPVLSPTEFGVDVDRIFYWWRSYGMRGMCGDEQNQGRGTPRPQFKVLSARNNCAGTTALALIVGGASYFKSRVRQYRVSTPKGVRDWAKEVRDAALEINRAKALSVKYELNEARKKRTALASKTKNIKQQNPKDLPTLQEWKDISYVGPLARRKEQIAAIDNALRQYHEIANWDAGHDDKKALLLDEIIRQAENHAITKPASDRLHAVTYMLAQAWKVLDERLRQFKEGELVISQVEFDKHGSLKLSPKEFEEIFMGDEWRTDVELEDIESPVVVEEDVDTWEWQAYRRENKSITGSQGGLFASGVSEKLQSGVFANSESEELQPDLFASGVSENLSSSFFERMQRRSSRRSSARSLGSMQGK